MDDVAVERIKPGRQARLTETARGHDHAVKALTVDRPRRGDPADPRAQPDPVGDAEVLRVGTQIGVDLLGGRVKRIVGRAPKSENAVIARLVFVCIPGHTPLWAAVVCHWPPRSSLASKTTTSNPASSACLVATRPLGPAPTIATRAPDRSLTQRRYPIK
jgi:hypothetical protein